MEITETVLQAGRTCEGTIHAVEVLKTARRKYVNMVVYAAGRIQYRDDIGNRATTAFLRVLDSNARFNRVGDDNYEYED
jgi:hypothetical protein